MNGIIKVNGDERKLILASLRYGTIEETQMKQINTWAYGLYLKSSVISSIAITVVCYESLVDYRN